MICFDVVYMSVAYVTARQSVVYYITHVIYSLNNKDAFSSINATFEVM